MLKRLSKFGIEENFNNLTKTHKKPKVKAYFMVENYVLSF